MSLRTQSAKRRTSFIEIETNPFESPEDASVSGGAGAGAGGMGGGSLIIENLADTVKIEPSDLEVLLSALEALRSAESSLLPLLVSHLSSRLSQRQHCKDSSPAQQKDSLSFLLC